MSEQSDVTKPILDALAKIPGVVAWRQSAGLVKVRRGYVHLAPEGTPDIIGFQAVVDETEGGILRRAVFFGIECKKAGNKTKKSRAEAQAAWGERLRGAGGLYVVARSVGEALRGLGFPTDYIGEAA